MSRHTLHPSTLFPLPNCRQGLEASPSMIQPSQLLFRPPVFKGPHQRFPPCRKEMTAHDHHAESLSFHSSFLKHWGNCGGRQWRKYKNSYTRTSGLHGGSTGGLQAPSCGQAFAVQQRPPAAARNTTHSSSGQLLTYPWSRGTLLKIRLVARRESCRSTVDCAATAPPPPPGWESRRRIQPWNSL